MIKREVLNHIPERHGLTLVFGPAVAARVLEAFEEKYDVEYKRLSATDLVDEPALIAAIKRTPQTTTYHGFGKWTVFSDDVFCRRLAEVAVKGEVQVVLEVQDVESVLSVYMYG